MQYNRDVRPILFENCFSCHGPDSASRQAELRLDKREAAVDKTAIVPGNADSSEMIRRILSDDAGRADAAAGDEEETHRRQKQALVRWIKEGAEYQPIWSLIAPCDRPCRRWKDQELGSQSDRQLCRRKARVGRPHARAEADRRTLARRVSLDLTGLPPTPERSKQFVNDEKPDAYERFVDKLLASPKWGEHRGRYWLDAARYGDTHGIHIDNYREIWSYRDWVIDAFNKNMPFDQFTIENLAGDLLAARDARTENRLRFQSLQHHHQRRRRDSTRSTPCSTRAIASKRRRKSGWASPPAAPCVTTTNSIRSRRKSSTNCRRSSITRRRNQWTATSKTRRRSSWCRKKAMRPGWTQLTKQVPETKKLARRPPARRRDRVRRMAGTREAGGNCGRNADFRPRTSSRRSTTGPQWFAMSFAASAPNNRCRRRPNGAPVAEVRRPRT